MIEDINDFASQFFEPERPPRDGSGQPRLIPRGVEIHEDNRVTYSRASGLADVLEEFSYLWKWKMRGLAMGLSQSEDLIRLAAAETYTCGFVPVQYDESDTDKERRAKAALADRENKDSGRRVDVVIERALDRAGVDMKADYGTAIHLRTESGNTGVDPDEKQAKDVESCWQLWRDLGVVHLGTEVFTACDELRSAGTFDHLSYVPGLGIIVTDKKTSAKAKSTYDVQLSGYSRSDVYDKDTDERMTLEEYIESKGWNPALLNRSVGLIWWVKDGQTQARQLDLDNGWKWAKIAAEIRDERRKQGVAKNITPTLLKKTQSFRDELFAEIQGSNTLEALGSLWDDRTIRAIWTDDHTIAAKARKEELT